MASLKFGQFLEESKQLDEAFNSAPYELTMGKKNAGDVFFTFIDEDEKEFRIQFYTPQGLGKNVRQVFIGQKRGSTYPDAIARFKNPMRVIASMIEATKQFLATPLGKTIDGYAVNFSKKALDRGMTLIPKIIRQSGLKQKLNVMDLTYAPVPDRGYVWLVRKGKDPAVVFDGPKMQGITWDDPDKIGDVPPEQTPSADGQPSSGVAQHMTSRDLDAHPFRQKVLEMIDAAVTKEGIATPGGSKGYYKFTNGGTFRVYFDKVQNDTFFGSLSTAAGSVEIKSPFNASYAAGDFMIAIRKAAPQKSGGKLSHLWNYTLSGNPGEERHPLLTFGSDRTYTVFGSPKSKMITGTHHGQKYRGTSLDAVLKKIGASMPSDEMIKQFKDDMVNPANMGKPNSNPEELPTTDMGQEGLKELGYIARLLGIIDTYAPQMVGMYSGEKLSRTGAGRYKTSGGLSIEVHFWGIDNGKLAVEVHSELSGTNMMSLSGKTKDAGMQIVQAISNAAAAQFNGEVEVRSVPINGAPYAIQKISRSQGYSYVDCGSFTLKVADALLSRFTVGKAVELDLMREFPRSSFPVRYDWYSKTEMVVKASDGKTIFGSINTNASDKDAVITANLREPSQGKFFGETVNGFSIAWDKVKFPKGGDLEGASLVTNYTFDRNGSRNIAIVNTLVVKGNRTINSPKGYAVPLELKAIQKSIDNQNQKYQAVSTQISLLNSSNYNPTKAFVNDVTIDDFGTIKFQGKDLQQSAHAQAVISALAAVKDPGKAGSAGKKSGADLSTYANSVRDNAPASRDVDWRANVSGDSKTLTISWDLTFRRNSITGAFREYSAQVNRANSYLETVAADAKKKGYKIDNLDPMTLEKAQRWDDMSRMNGDGPYSEYEQSLGGRLIISI